MSDRDIQKRLVEQAKQCRTTRGAAMLLSVKHWIDGTEIWDEPEELHATADRLCSTPETILTALEYDPSDGDDIITIAACE